jgi:hypothetical protein
MLRLILAILAGFIVTALLSTGVDLICHAAGIFPPFGEPFFDTGPYLLALGYRAIFQVLGAYVAALIAKEKAKAATWTIGILGTVLWLAGLLATKGLGPAWYGVAGAVLSIPTTLAGLWLYQRRSFPPLKGD